MSASLRQATAVAAGEKAGAQEAFAVIGILDALLLLATITMVLLVRLW